MTLALLHYMTYRNVLANDCMGFKLQRYEPSESINALYLSLKTEETFSKEKVLVDIIVCLKITSI